MEVAGLLGVGDLAALVADELAGVEVVAAQVVAQVGEVAEPGVAGDAERLVPRRRLHVLRDLLELGVHEGALAAAVHCLGLLHLWLLTFPVYLFSYFYGHFEGFKTNIANLGLSRKFSGPGTVLKNILLPRCQFLYGISMFIRKFGLVGS